MNRDTGAAANAEPRGIASRQVRRGLAAHGRGNHAKAFRCFDKAARSGDTEGEFRLGLSYAHGEGVVGSLADAIVWLRRAAEKGHVEAQYQLSLAYLHGGSVDGGVSTWYSRAAAIDQGTAERNRELMFPHGIQVPADPAEALRWARAAAEQGHAGAQANLALMYARGLG